MGGPYFVSYSRAEAAEFVLQLADRLVAGPPSYGVWLDVRDVRPGVDWDDQIRDAIQTCRGLLFVMTKDSVQDHSVAKAEWVWALKYKKPVIPLRVDADAGLPFRLSSRQYIDFSDGFDVGLAQLRTYLGWVGSPGWVLQDLRDQLTEAERELPRARPSQRPRIEQDIHQLRQRAAEQARLLVDPNAATRRTQERIAAGLEQERKPARPTVAPARARFVNPPPIIAPGYFQDRHDESELVGDFLRSDGERIMTLVGRGGVGKTAIVCRVLKALEGGRLPDDLGELVVDGIVYLSPAGAHPVNFPNLFTDLCRLLPQETADWLLERYRDPHQTPTTLMYALLDAFASGRVIMLLDNADDVIDTSADDFGITDTALDEALRALLTAPAHGVKVILTTRVPPRGLLLMQPERQRRLNLDEGLGSPYAERLLRSRDPDGRLGLRDAPDDLLDGARQRTRGYPRALEALAAILAADRDATLPELLDQTARLPENVVEVLVGEAFKRLDPLAQQVMQALAIYTAPVPPVAVDYLLEPYQPAIDAAPVLGRLVNMQFVRREAGRYYLHQVDRDYALGRIPTGQPTDREAEPAPFTMRALRHRGGDYFQQVRTPRGDWKTLDDLAPQLAEFELRYQGDDYDTAAHVLLSVHIEYLSRWGHDRLTAEMYQRLQGHLDDPWIDAASKSALGACYQSLGQIHRAIDLHEQALTISREIGTRDGEAVNLGNLGNRYAELGQIHRAIDLHEQALAIYHAIGDQQGQANQLCALGISYWRLGQTARAIDLHEQALAIFREIGDRYGEALTLDGLADAHGDLGAWDQATACSRKAIDAADAISNAQAQSDAHRTFALYKLLAGDTRAAQEAALAAHEHNYRPDSANLSVLLGISLLRQDQPAAAAREFRDAITHADELLQYASDAYEVLNAKALALCGLALTTDPDKAGEAAAVFRTAQAVTSAGGIIRQTLALFDALAAADRADILAEIRPAAEGKR